MEQVEIVKKSKSAMIVLSTRTLVLNVFQILSRIILAKNLLPEDFGTFGVIQGWIGTLMFFTDVGLGDVLVRRSVGISEEDFSGYFYLRLCLGLLMAVLFLIIYPLLSSHYNFTFNHAEYVGIIGLFIVMDVIVACPMVLMGHKMDFASIAKIELGGAVMTYIIQIAISFFIKGPWAFFIGLFGGKLFSIMLTMHFAGKIPFPRFSKELLKLNFSKGFLFQIANILPSLQAIVFPFIMSYFINVGNIGLIFWIEGLVGIPLNIIFNYNRVAFISLSKFAEDPERLREVVSSFMAPVFLGICFVFGLGAILSKQIIIIIFGSKWIEATAYVHFSCISFSLYCLRYLGLSVLSAVNAPHWRVMNELVLILLTSLLLGLGIYFFGIKGYFYGCILSYLICLSLMVYTIRDYINRYALRRLVASLLAMALTIVLGLNFNLSSQKIIVSGPVFLILFFSIAVLLDASVINELQKVRVKVKGILSRI